jgi:sigma-E factor negative regulatory protein RseA
VWSVDEMSESVKEQLSAFLDGELPSAELELLLKRSARDAELCDTLRRYAAASEALKPGGGVAARAGFAAGVMAALENEPAISAPRQAAAGRVLRSLRPVAGLAVAAGVAAVAVLVVQNDPVTPDQVAGIEAPAPALATAAPEAGASYTVPSTTSRSAFVPATRLTNYVVAHSEYSSPLGRRAVLSGVLAEDDPELTAPDDAPSLDSGLPHP